MTSTSENYILPLDGKDGVGVPENLNDVRSAAP